MSQHHISPTDKVQMAMAVKQGTVMGINDAFMVATYLTILAFILAFFIRTGKPIKEGEVANQRRGLRKVPEPQ